MIIREYTLSHERPAAQLLGIWRLSVTATHTFLSAADIENISRYVPQAIEQVPNLTVLEDETGTVAGFAGVAGHKLEMLFLHPDFRGKGYGKVLVRHLIDKKGVDYVCVNEQNPAAAGFYEHMGFRIVGRDETDEQGSPFPILHMELQTVSGKI